MSQSTPTVLDVLMTAKKILSNPKRWTKGTLVQPNAEGESCYCALGAICKAIGVEQTSQYEFDFANNWLDREEGQGKVFEAAKRRLSDSMPGRHKGRWVPGFNDATDTTHTDVMQAFSNAIDAELAKREAGAKAQIPAVS